MKLQYRMQTIMQKTSSQNIMKPILGQIMNLKKTVFTDIKMYSQMKTEIATSYSQAFDGIERMINRFGGVYVGYYAIKNNEASFGKYFRSS